MVYGSLACGMLMGVVLLPRVAQPPAPPAEQRAPAEEAQPAAMDPGAEQAQIALRYRKLEESLLKIAQKLERSGTPEGLKKSRMIQKALREAREKAVAIGLVDLAEVLKKPGLTELKTAVEKGTILKDELELMLATLLAEDDPQEQIKTLTALLKDLDRALREQKIALSKNLSPHVDKQEAAKAQEIARRQVQELREKIRQLDAKSGKASRDRKSPDAKPKDAQPPASQKPDSKPRDGQGQDSKPREGQSPDGPAQDGKPKAGKSSDGQSPQGDSSDDAGKPNDQPDQTPPDAEDGISRQRLQDAEQAQRQALDKIDQEQRESAAKDQDKAREELEQARKRLEEVLRQMREEEAERVLADMQKRCEKLLQMQEVVYEATKKIHGRIQTLGRTEREDELASRRQADEQEKIVAEADRAIALIQAEGSAVAFAEVFMQVRGDMAQVSRRLARIDVGRETLLIEEDIIASLKEMIEALKKQQKEQKERKNAPPPPEGGQPPAKELIDKLAELRMMKSMQLRVNVRTTHWAQRYVGEEAQEPEIVRELLELAQRQARIHRIADDLAKGRNK